MLSWEERRQLVKVASFYYREGFTQEQIAKKIGVSRPFISKQLQKAKDYGIVEVFIKDETVHTVELEGLIEERYGLKDVVVVPIVDQYSEMRKKVIGQVAANYIIKNLKDVKSIGIGWGSTLAELVREYPYENREDVKIIPLVGGMGTQQVDIHANQLAYELAKKMNGSCSYLYAPAIIDSEELKNRLVDMQDVKSVLEDARKVDLALVGIGNPYKESTLEKIGYVKQEDIEDLRKCGAIGDIISRFLDYNGQPINHPINEKVIGITLDELKKIQIVIGVVEGRKKLESIRGALRGNYLDILIIDEASASELLLIDF
ncbi:sugar-binding transcriptional regulator [Neobacillus cucumis]|uniref:sugar-binding transcriptional regulator n=1 Tax=Neobacillus cucumis TaxID=1740721 RepID=UPI00203C6D60|nr:sugar-binding transcriptional regulator [Neobacillus cucumis]MCM3728171.1 sugar-binding transcriptional regulator [Neobacillus cucumis]